MKLTLVLLSPTFGMHQYTAHLAARATSELEIAATVFTTRRAPFDRYAKDAQFVAPLQTTGTGFSPEGLDARSYRSMRRALFETARGGAVHFTGVHLWNLPLVHALQGEGIRVVHTLHDLTPHSDTRRGRLIRLWNRLLVASGAALLVHGECYRQTLLGQGVPAQRVRCAPLVHGFWAHDAERAARDLAARTRAGSRRIRRVLFFGRIEKYKGVDTLIEAWARLSRNGARPRDAQLVIAGARGTRVTLPRLPAGVELRDRQIGDKEGLALFGKACLLVLPYRDATQSALVATAARFGAPSLVTRSGALPEYVADGETGWVVPPGNPDALAASLEDCLSDGARLRTMGEAAREWHERVRGREIETLAALYARVTEPRRAPSRALVSDADGGWHRQP